MKNYGFQTLIVFAVIVLFSVLAVNGQTCNLNLSVYSFENRAKEELITDISIEFGKEKSNKKIIPASKERNGYFENISPGEYWASVSKAGFKKTKKWFPVNCDFASQGTVEEAVFLWAGDSKEEEEIVSAVFSVSPTEPNAMAKNVTLVEPQYPGAARAVKAGGPVGVQVLVNELGRVVFAKAVSGNPLLYASSVAAAKLAKFKPVTIQGMPVKISGIIVYNFVP